LFVTQQPVLSIRNAILSLNGDEDEEEEEEEEEEEDARLPQSTRAVTVGHVVQDSAQPEAASVLDALFPQSARPLTMGHFAQVMDIVQTIAARRTAEAILS
jgi:hypothetical protein